MRLASQQPRRDWQRRWSIRPDRDSGGYVMKGRWLIVRNGIVAGSVRETWGRDYLWRVYLIPHEQTGTADTLTEALAQARDALGLRPIRPQRTD